MNKTLDQLLARTKLTSDGCRIWQGAFSGNGYGNVNVGVGKNMPAHRAVWILANGPLAPDEVVCHTCDVRACVNVSHLFIGSQKDNLADMRAKGRGAHGEKLVAAIKAGWTPELRKRRGEQTKQHAEDAFKARRKAAGVPDTHHCCAKCREWKHLDDFSKRGSRRPTYCKECRSIHAI